VWEGVTPYLDVAAVEGTFDVLRTHSMAGSLVIFDYVYQDVVDGTSRRPEVKWWIANTRRRGEPLRFGINPGSVATFLERRGFQLTENVDH
jgi:O-methyltransferase involved in polyketide biosynthesis